MKLKKLKETFQPFAPLVAFEVPDRPGRALKLELSSQIGAVQLFERSGSESRSSGGLSSEKKIQL